MKRFNLAILAVLLAATGVGDQAQALTRVELEATQTSATISPLLFGHHLEFDRRLKPSASGWW